jgi:glycosyltransferase involved in cell wall biosynthesis
MLGSDESRSTDRVAFFLGELGGGGAQRVMITLANGFAGRGHEVDAVVAHLSGPLVGDFADGVRTLALDRKSVMAAVPRLATYLRRARPTALVATLDHTNVAAVLAAALSGAPTRVFVRVASTLDVIESGGLRHRVLRSAVRLAYRRAAGVIAVSEGVAADVALRTAVPRELIHTIYNPVVDDDFDRRASDPVDHPWLRDGAKPVVLGVGRLEPQKDFSTLLRAVALVRTQRDVRLIILGEGAQRAELVELAGDLGLTDHVDMPGFVQNPLPYMRHADAFVLSSRFEGLPGALIQAMAAGCPVVSTDCPSGPSEVLEGGAHGPLVPVGDPKAMADAVLGVLDEPRPERELRSAADRFRVGVSLDAYERLVLPRG